MKRERYKQWASNPALPISKKKLRRKLIRSSKCVAAAAEKEESEEWDNAHNFEDLQENKKYDNTNLHQHETGAGSFIKECIQEEEVYEENDEWDDNTIFETESESGEVKTHLKDQELVELVVHVKLEDYEFRDLAEESSSGSESENDYSSLESCQSDMPIFLVHRFLLVRAYFAL